MQKRAEQLWTIDHPLVLGGLHLGTRTTVVGLGKGKLLVHSPGPLEEEDFAEIEKAGEVASIVAPNLLHHMFVRSCQARFPGATLHAPRRISEKETGFPSFRPLDSAAPSPWADVALLPVLGAPALDEFVFFHRQSKTMILTDIAFNFQRTSSLLTSLFMRLNGAYGRFGPTRLGGLMFKDKKLVRESVQAMLDWDFERIVVAHGEVLESGGKGALHDAFWKAGRSS